MSTKVQTKVQANTTQTFTSVLHKPRSLSDGPHLILQRRDLHDPTALPIVQEVQPGQPVPGTPAFFDPRFGHDFNRVRIFNEGAGRNLPIQAKLRINKPGDVYEEEADRVADAVMRMPEPGVRWQVEEEKEETLQAKEIPSQIPEVTPNLEAGINTIRGSGQPLPESTRAFFEPRFGRDFSQVRVHTDAQAAEAARVLNARAFTLGEDVVFGAGEYGAESGTDRKLLTHELTHVVQQARGLSSIGNTPHLLMRQLSKEEKKTINKSVTETISNELFSKEDLKVHGPVPVDISKKAIAHLEIVRTILGDVHSYVNSALIGIQFLEEMEMPKIFTLDFLLNILYESDDSIAKSTGAKLESIAIVVTKIIKVIGLAVEHYYNIKEKNKALFERGVTISFLLDQIMMAKVQVDELKKLVQSNYIVAEKLSDLEIPKNPAKEAIRIGANIEFSLIKSLIKRKGGFLEQLRTSVSICVKQQSLSLNELLRRKLNEKKIERGERPVSRKWFQAFFSPSYDMKEYQIEIQPEEILPAPEEIWIHGKEGRLGTVTLIDPGTLKAYGIRIPEGYIEKVHEILIAECKKSEQYKLAFARHNDPYDNWHLYRDPIIGYGLNSIGIILNVLRLRDIPEEVIIYTLKRMNSGRISKKRLYSQNNFPIIKARRGKSCNIDPSKKC